MTLHIDSDHARFREIVKGRVRRNLRKLIAEGGFQVNRGGKKIAIPIHEIRLPRFQYEWDPQSGVGQGPGKPGDVIGRDRQEGEGDGTAGNRPGEHPLEAEMTFEELARILGEELELPRVKPKGKRVVRSVTGRFTGIRRTGPESLIHFKRTFKEALKRSISSGEYKSGDPVVIPAREDKRYRARKEILLPQSAAVIIYMMDVSGSMGDEQKEIVRREAFWLDLWLKSNYKNLQVRYVTHDADAREVDRETFFKSRESGGTLISSAYTVTENILRSDYPAADWNVYLFHFSDGDNWSDDDNAKSVELLSKSLLPRANLFAYGQVKSAYGSGTFYKVLEEAFAGEDNVELSLINSKDEILDSIRTFLGKGR